MGTSASDGGSRHGRGRASRTGEDGAPGVAHVQSLARALMVLSSFDEATPTFTIAELAAKTGLDRAAARRYLLTLQSLGYVGSHKRRFHLRPRVLQLGHAYFASSRLPDVLQPALDALAADVGESCAITVLDGDEIVFVAAVNSTATLAIKHTVGNRFPAHSTAMGRVLLAGEPADGVRAIVTRSPRPTFTARTRTSVDDVMHEIDRARRAGWAVVDQEVEVGVRTVAIPLHDREGNVAAAASISVPAARVTVEFLSTSLRSALMECMAEVQGQMPPRIGQRAADAP